MTEQAVAVREIISSRVQEPEVEIAKGKRKADALMKVVRSTHLLSSKIGEKEYLRVEAWETIARFEGLLPNIVWTRKIEEAGEHVGYEARAEWVTLEGQSLGVGAESECRFEEENWNLGDKSKNAVKSMAQTRAVAKLGRQCFAWIAVLAGFSPTPAEEIEQTVGSKPPPAPACPQCGNAKSVIIGKAEYGGGWVCWKKRGGCGHQWGAESPKGGQRVEDLPPTTKGGDADSSTARSGLHVPDLHAPADTATPPSAEGGGEPSQRRLDAALADSAAKDEWWQQVDKQMERVQWTKAKLTKYVMETHRLRDPNLMNLEQVKALAMYLGTLEVP